MMKSETKQPHKSSIGNVNESAKPTWAIYKNAFAASAGHFICGAIIVTINKAWKQISEEFKLTPQIYFYFILINYFTVCVTCFVTGVVADSIGRRQTIILGNVLNTVGLLLKTAAYGKNAGVAMFYLARVICGVGVGFLTVGSHLYVTECVPTKNRGRLLMLPTVLFTISVYIFVNLSDQFKENSNGWRFIFGIPTALSAILTLISCIIPQTPRFLALQNKWDKATEALRLLWGKNDVSEEYKKLTKCIQNEENVTPKAKSFKGMFTTPHIRFGLFVGSAIFFFQQFGGVNLLLRILEPLLKSNFEPKTAYYTTQICAALTMFAVLTSLYLVEVVGRVRILIISFTAVATSMLLFTYTYWHSYEYPIETSKLYEPTIGINNCLENTNCQECTKLSGCGYCYVKVADDYINASCVDRSEGIDSYQYSKYGRCSRYNGTDNRYKGGSEVRYAEDFCPTKQAVLAVLGIVSLYIGYGLGAMPVPWVVSAEIFPLWCMSKALSVTYGFRWFSTVLFTTSSIWTQQFAAAWGFLFLCASLNFMGAVFCYLMVPEMSGKDLGDVEEFFKNKEEMHEQEADVQERHSAEEEGMQEMDVLSLSSVSSDETNTTARSSNLKTRADDSLIIALRAEKGQIGKPKTKRKLDLPIAPYVYGQYTVW